MQNKPIARSAPHGAKPEWIWYAVIILVCEKILQHTFVTIAFYLNWADIGSTVALSPRLLMILGAMVAGLFILSLWGMLTHRKWAIPLVIALCLFDIVGEFVAQGRLDISVTVSFLVAIILLCLCLFYGMHAKKHAPS